jgi:NOL1/NOP2/fmu family ribosome biogenesis protein
MNYLKILRKKEKEEVEKKLSEQFGIEEIPGVLAMRGKDRLFFFSGNFREKQIKVLEKCVFIERIGIYFAKIIGKDIRLSIEGVQILKNQITKNIFELDENQTEEWMKGRELPIKTGEHGFLIMKSKEDFLGTGKASEEKIGNFIPKNRRLKERSQ